MIDFWKINLECVVFAVCLSYCASWTVEDRIIVETPNEWRRWSTAIHQHHFWRAPLVLTIAPNVDSNLQNGQFSGHVTAAGRLSMNILQQPTEWHIPYRYRLHILNIPIESSALWFRTWQTGTHGRICAMGVKRSLKHSSACSWRRGRRVSSEGWREFREIGTPPNCMCRRRRHHRRRRGAATAVQRIGQAEQLDSTENTPWLTSCHRTGSSRRIGKVTRYTRAVCCTPVHLKLCV